MVRLSNNQMVAATEFFDEDDDKLEYSIGEPVWATWVSGWRLFFLMTHKDGFNFFH